ncbi:MAG TPA: putative collagen-binding domain-containing protein, partial [Mycobacterium sp.]|nr:putative collagen-binding domain-containing protein [Mycobacterium sp.]
DEQAHLDTPGVIQLQYMENLFTAREWFNLVPDQQHSFLTAGMGTYDSSEDDVLQSDYATAAVTPDGGFGAVYVPTARTITVNLNALAGNVTVRWFDPSNNTFAPVAGSPFAPASGSQQFTTPGPNSEGNGDWLLVLDGNATADTTAPSTPSGVTVGGTTGSTVSLSWAPSSDNIGVASYRIFRNGTQVGTSTSTSFTDTGLDNNTTYSYTVVAVDFAGNVSSPSAPVNATTTASPPPPSSPTFVQQNSVTPQTAQSTVTVSYAQPQTTGNLNVVVVGWYSTNATITSVTDSAGNTYAVAAPLKHSSQMYQAIYYAKNIGASAAGNVVTVKFSAAVQFADIRLAEYSGLDTVNPFDTTSSGTGSPATATSGNVTTSKPVELLVGAGDTSGLFTAAGSGYTKRVITNPDGDILEDRVVTATGSYAATAAQSGDEVMQVVAFKAAGQ